MNYWTKLSIEYANQKSYLDDLFQVYPAIPEGIREINPKLWANIEIAFERKDNLELVKQLLRLNLFPIKDSYVAYLKRDLSALDRNPKTINRIAVVCMKWESKKFTKDAVKRKRPIVK